ncbi:cytochrome P450 alkane hydroxylase-like protein [Bisporella sp. PMI_857]|nr:cytochrome P450 alkane hydroxylase-like protein [Bisporella sp. PMI_857]
MKNRWPLGLDQLKRSLSADRNNIFPSDLYQRYLEVGAITYTYSMLGATNYFTADEKNIQAVLATQFDDFDLGPIRRKVFAPLIGNGIFTADGKEWAHSRAMMRPQFARDQVSDLDLEERHIQALMKVIDFSLRKDGWTDTINLQDFFVRLTLDTATEFLFGQSVDTQFLLGPGNRTSGGSKVDFAKNFDVAQTWIATRFRLMDKYWLCNPKEFRDTCKACHDFIDTFVRRELSRKPDSKPTAQNGREKYIFLSALVTQTRDPIELRSQLFNILLAGRDTTSSFLGWIFFNLARDPTRYRRLRDVVLAEFGTYDNPSEITFTKLKECRYLQWVGNEVLRLYPMVPFNSRCANRDTTLPRGGGPDGQSKVFIPAGTQVDYAVHVLHHRKDIWGPDAEEFIPERWENRKAGWEFLPFNGGPRICLGQQFALTEASYVTVRLLQRFDRIENMDMDSVIRHGYTVINSPGNGVKVRLHAAGN